MNIFIHVYKTKRDVKHSNTLLTVLILPTSFTITLIGTDTIDTSAIILTGR